MKKVLAASVMVAVIFNRGVIRLKVLGKMFLKQVML